MGSTLLSRGGANNALRPCDDTLRCGLRWGRHRRAKPAAILANQAPCRVPVRTDGARFLTVFVAQFPQTPGRPPPEPFVAPPRRCEASSSAVMSRSDGPGAPVSAGAGHPRLLENTETGARRANSGVRPRPRDTGTHRYWKSNQLTPTHCARASLDTGAGEGAFPRPARAPGGGSGGGAGESGRITNGGLVAGFSPLTFPNWEADGDRRPRTVASSGATQYSVAGTDEPNQATRGNRCGSAGRALGTGVIMSGPPS